MFVPFVLVGPVVNENGDDFQMAVVVHLSLVVAVVLNEGASVDVSFQTLDIVL